MENSPVASVAMEYLFKQASLIMMVLDQQGQVVQVNQHTRNLLGAEFFDTPRTLNEVLVDFGKLPSLEELMREGENPRMLNINTAEGLPHTYYFTFYKSENQLICLGQVDHHELEMLRRSLLESNNQANNLTRELYKKNTELNKLDNLKNQFLGMAAHDLRNPLGIIRQYADFLINEMNAPQEQDKLEFLNRIRSSSDYMLNLLDDLLDIAKIESGKLELNLKNLDLARLTREVVVLNKAIAATKNISVQFHSFENLPVVSVDQTKMEQVLNNLISNAIKFSPAHTTITVSVFRTGDYLMISVLDQGHGIPREEIPFLFQPYTTTSVMSTAGEKSTGLGLAIVSKIVVAHRGKIWIKSKVGQGSIFFVAIPISPEVLRRENEQILNVNSQINPRLGKELPLHVAVVDDEPEHAHLLRDLLKRMGYHPSVLYSAKDALEWFSQESIDLVFMDIHMPEIDGITAAKHIIQHHPIKRRPKIIAVTGYKAEKDAYLNMGINDYLAKPVNPVLLQRVIERWGHIKARENDSLILEQQASSHDASLNQPHPETTSVEILNHKVIEDLCQMDPKFFNELVEMFIEQTSHTLNDLESELTINLALELEKLRGSATNVGALAFEQQCQSLKELKPGTPEFKAQLNKLQSLFEQTQQALKQYPASS